MNEVSSGRGSSALKCGGDDLGAGGAYGGSWGFGSSEIRAGADLYALISTGAQHSSSGEDMYSRNASSSEYGVPGGSISVPAKVAKGLSSKDRVPEGDNVELPQSTVEH